MEYFVDEAFVDSFYLLNFANIHWQGKHLLLFILGVILLSDERDVRKEKKKTYDNQLENKHRRAHKADAKIKAEIYKEQTQTPKDGDYKVSNDKQNNNNNNKPKWKRNRTPYDRGEGRVH